MVNTKRVERLLKLIQALQSGRSKTVEDLAKLAGVSRRTVFRDLELLARAGIRYTYDRHTRRYSTEQTMLLPPVTLTHSEALALLLAARYVISHRGISHEAVAASAALKLESMLPPPIRDYCGSLMERMEIRGDRVSDTTSILDTISILQTAILHENKVRVRYDSYYEGRVIDVVLHPYRLAYIHRGWYLIAFTEQTSRVQTYKIERILRIRMLDAVYTIDPAFNLDSYFGDAWLMIRGETRYHVKVRFLSKVAGNVDEIHWHKTQSTSYEADGSLLFEADVDGVEEISWWILGYGDQAQVLEPPELRELVAARVAHMHEYYHSDGPYRTPSVSAASDPRK